MKSRNKIIVTIIAVWVILVSIILFLSQSIFVSGFEKLEKDLAADSANRVYHVSLSALNYLYLLNTDNAYWDKTYDYMQHKNPKFIQDNFIPDFFYDNKINYIIVLNDQNNVVWSSGFNFSQKKYEPVPADVVNYFVKQGKDILVQKDKYYEVRDRDYGASGFLKLANNDIAYFALNFIKDSNDKKPAIGLLVFGKILTEDYLTHLSQDLSYPITIVPLTGENAIVNALSGGDAAVYTTPLSDNVFLSYKLLKDFTNKPIALLRIEQSRKVYNESKKSASSSQLLLLGFSMLGVFAMSLLVYWFFRKQDLITRSFERFVPHQLIDLLNKKDILEINLGDNSKRNMAVLFMDIRNFTTISEGLSSQDNFDFINMLLKRIAPVVSQNNGFVDKYIGDAVMALFPHQETSADDAVKAAVLILTELDKLNNEGVLRTKSPVKIGIGINTGEAMLGIIGAEGRLEGTVISDMVNTASRIQSLTKNYSCEILISELCYRSLKYPKFYKIEHVDDVLVKGKTQKISVYSVSYPNK